MQFLVWAVGAALLLAVQMSTAVEVQRAEVLHSFRGNDVDGSQPFTGLVWGPDRALYGTTSGAAELSDGPLKYGSIFRLTLDGSFTTLFAFSKTNGWKPNELILADDGNFYGTTQAGGQKELAAGTVFRMTPGGELTTLFEFEYAHTNGATPSAGLVQGIDGAFYGTTANGITSETPPYRADESGTVFRITKEGKLTTLFRFSEQAISPFGGRPMAALIQGTNEVLYGTALRGGTNGHGTVFSITTSGVLTVLHHFTGTNDGSGPLAPLLRASDGFLYGSTLYGPDGGKIFRISEAGGDLTTLANFGWRTPLI